MKKITALLLAALLCVLALASCNKAGNNGEGGEDTAAAQSEAPADIISITTTNYQINNAMVSYFFNTAYQSDVSQYSSYLSVLGLDTTKSLKEQTYGTGTWFDYYIKAAAAQIQANLLFAELGRSQGMELTDDEKAEIDSYMTSIDTYVASNNTTTEAFLTDYYGNGVTTDIVRQCLEIQQIAYKAYNAFNDGLTYGDDECDKYFSEHTTDFLYCDYNAYTFSAEVPEDTSEEDSAATLAALKTEADKLAAATTEEEFNSLLTAYLTTLYAGDESKTADVIAAEVADTLNEKSTYATLAGLGFAEGTEYKAGISSVTEGTNSYTVNFLATTPARVDAITKSVRHILLTPTTYETEDAAKAKAEELLSGFLAGEKTETAFAALSSEYSEDTGSKTNGGLYENLSSTESFAQPFMDWTFDAARVLGDTDIITTTSGIHIMYFAGDGPAEWKLEVLSALKEAAYYSKIDELNATYSYNENTDNLNKLDA